MKEALIGTLLLSCVAMAQSFATRKALTLQAATQIAAAAEAEAIKNKWNVVIAIVDEGGHLIYLQRMDETQAASADIAPQKARTAVLYKRPSKVFEERATTNGQNVLSLPGVLASEGGLPITVEGRTGRSPKQAWTPSRT
jgi:glc operon protein GlcG